MDWPGCLNKYIMLSDPYIEVINKTRSFSLSPEFIEETTNYFLANGSVKTLEFLTSRSVDPVQSKMLLDAIRKEFRSSYKVNALYAAVFMLLFASCAAIMLRFSYVIGFWMLFFTALASYFLWRIVKNLMKRARL
mgnify:CR=1 FL=1